MALTLAVGAFIGTCRLFLHSELAPRAWLHFAGDSCTPCHAPLQDDYASGMHNSVY